MTARPLAGDVQDAFTSPEHLERIHGRPFALRLGANESTFGPSQQTIDAIRRELARVSWYGDSTNHPLLVELAATTGLPESRIAIGAGIDDLLDFATERLLRPGQTAVTTAGTYPMLESYVRANAGRCATVPYRSDLTVDLAALADLAVRVDAKIVYVANPDNPTGSYLPERELSDFCLRLPGDCALFLDEAYVEFAGQGPDVSRSTSWDPAARARVVRFRTFSKVHGLAGLRAGYAILGEDYADVLRAHRQSGVNRIAHAAALAAIQDQDHVRSVVDEVAAGRSDYAALGRRLGWRPLPSRTNFVTFRLASLETAVAWVEALARRGVFVRRGFAPPLDRCLRVTVGTRSERDQLADIAWSLHEVGMHDESSRASIVLL